MKTATVSKPRVLCVDDEPNVLEGLALTLRRGYDVTTAGSGEAGLEALKHDSAIAVVISDMRMPGMSGAAFLSKACVAAPDATRMLLTGQTDIEAAIAAINEGRIFRFLIKPCPPPTLTAAIQAAVEQNRLVTSERVLLEQTLHGSIRMLTDVLALAAPAAFGQAARIRGYARDLASKVPGVQLWPVEVAAMLSQIGYIALSPGTLESLRLGKVLAPEEQAAVERIPALAEQIIAGIPRLDEVRAALKYHTTAFDGAGAAPGGPRGKELPIGARVIRVVCDFDLLEAGGMSKQLAMDTLRGRRGRYDPELLELFASIAGSQDRETEVLEIPIRSVRVGMVFLQDVRTHSGALLIARGNEVTTSLVERFRNFTAGAVHEPVRVAVKRGPPPGN